jgi:hypothetical protein
MLHVLRQICLNVHIECGVNRSPDDGNSQSFDYRAPGAIGSNKVVAKHVVLARGLPFSKRDLHAIAVVYVANVFMAKPDLCTVFDGFVD